VEEKNYELESKDVLISELKENIQEKEKQIEELKASLAKGEKDLEKEYADKLTELTEEKARLEALLAEKERIWLDKEIEKKQLIVKLEEEIKGYKENINKLENEIVNLIEEAAKLAKGEKDLEKEYADKLSELTEEKARLEVLLTEKEETIKTIERQKEESEQIVILKDELVSELKENIQEKEKQIEELKASLTRRGEDLEKEHAVKVSELMKEKGQLEALLIEQEGILKTKDREKEELISKLENCNNQINELKVKLVQQEIEEEKDYVAELSTLTEEKNKLESQLKIYQDLLSEKEDTIVLIKQQNEESEKNIVEKDKIIVELSESIKGYENQIKEISEQAAKEKEIEMEKETEYLNKLSLLTEEKSKLETQLKASQDLLLEKENTIGLLKQQKEDSEKVISDKDKIMTELSESVKGYEDLVKEIQEQMAQEGKEKEAEYADRLALLKEGKDIIEAKLAEAIKKAIPDYYEVEKGDSLWKIAERFYSTGEKWIRIFEANSGIIKNPSIIYPYQRFTIPKE
jgi:LysM repeat protein